MDENKPVLEGPRVTKPRPRISPNGLLILMALLAVSVFLFFGRTGIDRSPISYDFFWKQLKDSNISEVNFEEHQLVGTFRKAPDAPAKAVGSGSLLDQILGSAAKRGVSAENANKLLEHFSVNLPQVEDPDLLPTLRKYAETG